MCSGGAGPTRPVRDLEVTLKHALFVTIAATALAVIAAPHASRAETYVEVPPAEAGYTWDALVTEIERTSPLMRAARAGLDDFQAKMAQARWAILPTFRLEAGAAPMPELRGNALESEVNFDRWGYVWRVNVTMVQPLWTFGKISSLREAARHGVAVGRAQVDVARWELRVRAAQAYYGALLARELDAILVEGNKWISRAEERMERQRAEDSDDYDQLEHLRLKTRVAEFYQLETDNRLLATMSGQGLRLLLSRPSDAPVALAADSLQPIAVTLLSADRYWAVAKGNDPKQRMARAAAGARRALADNKRAELWPDLVLAGEARLADSNVAEDQPTSFANDPYHARSVGGIVGLRWNLDIHQRLLRADEASAQADKAAQEAVVARDLQELKVRELHQRLENKRALIEVYAQAQRSAQGWLTANWDLYDAGFGSFRDVMDALVQFYSKKVAWLQNVHEHNVLVWELSQAVGADITQLAPAEPPQAPQATQD